MCAVWLGSLTFLAISSGTCRLDRKICFSMAERFMGGKMRVAGICCGRKGRSGVSEYCGSIAPVQKEIKEDSSRRGSEACDRSASTLMNLLPSILTSPRLRLG